MIPEVPKEEVEGVVNIWLETLRTPSVTAGVVWEDENFLNISTSWSIADVVKKERIPFVKSYGVLKSSLRWKEGQEVLENKDLIVTTSDPVPINGKKVCFSRDGSLKAILMDNSKASGENGKNKPEVLQIWNRQSLLKTYDLTELDKHKFIYTASDAFGATMAWSPDSKKLAYIAEKKTPKLKPFFTTYGHKAEDTNKDAKNDVTPGEEFALKQTWGEQLNDMHSSVLVVLDLDTDELKVLDLPETEFPADVQWVGNTAIIGTSYKVNDWKLGLLYCSNRESRIFKVNVDGTDFGFLSPPMKAASSPRVRPDGKYVVWQEREVDKPHRRPMAIIGAALDGVRLEPTVLHEASPANEFPSYLTLNLQAWTPDSKRFFFVTMRDGICPLMELAFDADYLSATCRSPFADLYGVGTILWSSDKYLLVSKSTTLEGPSIELIDISNQNFRKAVVIPPQFMHPSAKSISRDLSIFGKSTCPSIYHGPEKGSVPPNSVGLVVMSHGGPHSAYATVYNLDLDFFLRLGFAVLQVNYIGSLGSKKDETDELLGHIGIKDVEDCHNIVKQTLTSYPCIDPNKVVVFGGSHGGFLAGHLTSYAPDAYKAAAMLNPVCDLNTMIGTSDITDWVVAEAGLPFPDIATMSFIPAARSLNEAKKYIECSPITNVAKVKAPTLLLLGSEDLRVPMSQGMAYYRALKAHGKIAEVRVYPDCHPLSKVNVMTDSVIHCGLWFKRFLK